MQWRRVPPEDVDGQGTSVDTENRERRRPSRTGEAFWKDVCRVISSALVRWSSFCVRYLPKRCISNNRSQVVQRHDDARCHMYSRITKMTYRPQHLSIR